MPLSNENSVDHKRQEVEVAELSFFPTGTSTVTQQSNRSTGVEVNSAVGQITLNSTSLAAGAEAAFTVTNNKVTAKSVIIVNFASGQTALTSICAVTAVADGSFQITVSNLSAGTADTGAGVINFVVIGGN